jgi:hypothetical protein
MYTLADNELRALMKLLLSQDVFDGFDLRQLTIQSTARFDIEGGVPDEHGAVNYKKWSFFRPHAYNIVKAGGKPRYMKAVLACPAETVRMAYPGAQALFINIIFDKDIVHITTGAAMKTFSADKAEESRWDGYVHDFLKSNKLNIHENEG